MWAGCQPVEPIYAGLASFAASHHGLFRQSDASDHQITRSQLRRLVEQGWCTSISHGLYCVAAAPRTGRQAILAEVWAHEPGAVASHRAAAHLEALVGYRNPRPEVTLHRGRNQRRNQRVHTSLLLPEAHLTVIDGIPTTRVARTLFDLAGVEPAGRVEVALDDALSRKLCTLRQINQVFFALARRGRRGTASMRALLEARGEGYVPPASELERRARRLFVERGLPMPSFEVHLGDQELIGRVDCTWKAERLVVELDGRQYHGSVSAREADRLRDNRLMAAGWRVIRITWDDLRDRPDEIVDQIRAALALAS
jgi:REase_MTES_1575/Transcriptional regulator, AbiEi antitoxin